jgi:hypothetical protein
MFDLPESSILYASDSRGVFIPQYFAESVNRGCLSGVTDSDMETLLSGPDTDWYWEAWDSVIDSAVVTDQHGQRWTLYQDGDLWLLPEGWTPDDDSDD